MSSITVDRTALTITTAYGVTQCRDMADLLARAAGYRGEAAIVGLTDDDFVTAAERAAMAMFLASGAHEATPAQRAEVARRFGRFATERSRHGERLLLPDGSGTTVKMTPEGVRALIRALDAI